MSQREHEAEEVISRVAAAWAVRRDRGLTAAEQDEFLQWLAADARHGEWLARHEATWAAMDQLASLGEARAAQVPSSALLRYEPVPRRKSGWKAPMLVAAALAVGLSVALWRRPASPAQPAAVIVTAEKAAERRVLEDGSVVQLNRDTVIEARFTPADRQIAMNRGEAHFKVAKNPHRPFIVHADGVQVRAVGTAFNVKMTGNAVDVFVDEGRVQVTRPGADGKPSESLVAAGERAVVMLTPAGGVEVAQVSAEEAARLTAWRTKLLDFASVPLAEVVAEFNRYNDVQLVLADPELGGMPIVATMRSDNVEAFARLLELSGKVRVERSGEILRLTAVH